MRPGRRAPARDSAVAGVELDAEEAPSGEPGSEERGARAAERVRDEAPWARERLDERCQRAAVPQTPTKSVRNSPHSGMIQLGHALTSETGGYGGSNYRANVMEHPHFLLHKERHVAGSRSENSATGTVSSVRGDTQVVEAGARAVSPPEGSRAEACCYRNEAIPILRRRLLGRSRRIGGIKVNHHRSRSSKDD